MIKVECDYCGGYEHGEHVEGEMQNTVSALVIDILDTKLTVCARCWKKVFDLVLKPGQSAQDWETVAKEFGCHEDYSPTWSEVQRMAEAILEERAYSKKLISALAEMRNATILWPREQASDTLKRVATCIQDALLIPRPGAKE